MYDVGLASGAVLTINMTEGNGVKDATVFVVTSRQMDVWRDNRVLSPVLVGKTVSSYLSSYARYPLRGSLAVNRVIEAFPSDERYAVFVLNVHQEEMHLDGMLDYVNPGGQHLPLQLCGYIEAAQSSCVAFAVLAVVIVLALRLAWPRQASRLHTLLVVCLALKSVELGLRSVYLQVVAHVGFAPIWRYQMWHLFSKLHNVCEILFLLLAALGWRVLRPLPWLELGVALATATLAVILALLEVFCESDDNDSGISFKLLFYLVTVMCYLSIVFAMNINLQLITAHLADSPMSQAIAILYQKQKAYLCLRRVFVAIVFRPSVVTWIQLMIVSDAVWLSEVLSEGTDLAIYVCLFTALRPGHARFGLMEVIRASIEAGHASDERVFTGFPLAPAAAPPPLGDGTGLGDRGFGLDEEEFEFSDMEVDFEEEEEDGDEAEEGEQDEANAAEEGLVVGPGDRGDAGGGHRGGGGGGGGGTSGGARVDAALTVGLQPAAVAAAAAAPVVADDDARARFFDAGFDYVPLAGGE